jgi:carboxymethylenebutenolidase
METVSVADGAFEGLVVLPEAGAGPAIVLIQESFGVDGYLRAIAGQFAALGYVVVCPDLYWRVETATSLTHDDLGLCRVVDAAVSLDLDRAVTDFAVTVERTRALPEHRGGVALAGFRLGGSLACLAAADSHPDAVVSYHGSSVPEHLELLERIDCPVLLHAGGDDPFLPHHHVTRVEQVAAGRDLIELPRHDTTAPAPGRDRGGCFHDPAAAGGAWAATVAFLARHLPVR